jgi:hypothetical protein
MTPAATYEGMCYRSPAHVYIGLGSSPVNRLALVSCSSHPVPEAKGHRRIRTHWSVEPTLARSLPFFPAAGSGFTLYGRNKIMDNAKAVPDPKYPGITVQITDPESSAVSKIKSVSSALMLNLIPYETVLEFEREASADEFRNVDAVILQWVAVTGV